MTNTSLTLFCIVNGESTPFSVDIDASKTVHHLKESIKIKKTNDFSNVDADKLTLWRVSIPDNDNEEAPINLDSIPEKEKLRATTKLARAFNTELPDGTIHIVVQHTLPRPSDEIAVLRKQLSELQQLQSEVVDTSIVIGVVVKPDKKASLTWNTFVDSATLDDLKTSLVECHDQYANDEYLEIFVHHQGQPKAQRIKNDIDVRKLLKTAMTTGNNKLVVSLDTPSKKYTAWSFKDVCDEFNLSQSSDPGLNVIPPFTGIEASTLDSAPEMEALAQLKEHVGRQVDSLSLPGANEATKSLIVSTFLTQATVLFKKDLYFSAQRHLSGRRGHGPVDFSVHSRKDHDYTLGVTEVKKDDFVKGVAQNIVQLESAMTEKKRKRGLCDVDGDHEGITTTSYGIVTDANRWMLIECTLCNDESVNYKMSELERTLNFQGKWLEDIEYIFARLVWLWSMMRKQVAVRETYNNNMKTSPVLKKVAL